VTEEPDTQATADPLEMADNLVGSVHGLVNEVNRDPVAGMVSRLGKRAFDQSQMAGSLALVSIARDLRRIADHLTGGGS
jgi:hypothetical protein